MILVIIICSVMIAGILFGVLYQNGSCRSDSNNDNRNVPSSTPTSCDSNNDDSNRSIDNTDALSSAPAINI
jgi:hypothetical protein